MAKASLQAAPQQAPLGPETRPPFTKASRCKPTVRRLQVRRLPSRGVSKCRPTEGGLHISGQVRLLTHGTVGAIGEAIGEVRSQGGA